MEEPPTADPRLLLHKEDGRGHHLSIKGRCNLACAFCNCRGDAPDFEVDAHFAEVVRKIDELARAKIREATWGVFSYEPTTYPRLPELLRYARSRGIKKSQLITNGIRTADPAYLQELVDSGLTSISMTVFEYDEQSADALTGATGVLAAKLATAAACRRLGLTLFTPVILMRVNYQRVNDIVRLYADVSDRLSLEAIYPGMWNRVPWFLPPLSGMVESLAEICRRPWGTQLQLANVPTCIAARHERTLAKVRRHRDLEGRYSKICDGCAWRSKCSGLRQEYLDVYGDSEIAEGRTIHAPIALDELMKLVGGYIADGSGHRHAADPSSISAMLVSRRLSALLGELLLGAEPAPPCAGYAIDSIEPAHDHRAVVRLRADGDALDVLVVATSITADGLSRVGPLTLMLPRGHAVATMARRRALDALEASLAQAIERAGPAFEQRLVAAH